MKKHDVLKYQNYMDQYLQMLVFRRYTDHTITSYSTYLYAYLQYLDDNLSKDPKDVSWQEMRDFIDWLQSTRRLSDRTVNTVISQLRFFTVSVLGKPWDPYQLPFRKFDTYLPYVPSQEETFRFISTIPDIQVKAMIAVLYSSGLRHTELRELRYEDVKRNGPNNRPCIHIRHTKARADRYVEISSYALDTLTEYWKTCGKPRGYLFPGILDQSKPIDKDFLGKEIHKHEDRLGLPHRLVPHSFRHAFGTHLYENGANLMEIKERLGHKSLSSTLIYIHLADSHKFKTRNPLDKMAAYHEREK